MQPQVIADEEVAIAIVLLVGRALAGAAHGSRPKRSIRLVTSATRFESALAHTEKRKPRNTFAPMIVQLRTSSSSSEYLLLISPLSRAAISRPAMRRGGFIMFAIDLGFDELRFVDDSVHVATLARELQKRLERTPFAVERIVGILERGGDMVANLRRPIGHERLKHGLLGVEVSVEGAERDAGTLRDGDDRALGKAALAELVARRVEDLAQGPFPRAVR